MFGFSSATTLLVALACASVFGSVNAETHKVTLNNKCGHGTPLLKQNGKTLSTGKPYTAHGPFPAAIAFLQTGKCGADGESCTVVETTLQNPKTAGGGSSTDITLIPPLGFSVPVSFHYENGCDGVGRKCSDKNCPMAFRKPSDTTVQQACQKDNVNLVITFCG